MAQSFNAPAMESTGGREPTRLTARAIGFSVVVAAIIGFIFPWANLVLRGTRPANTSLPFGIIAVFFVLVAVVNPLIKLIGRRLSLRTSDLLVVFVGALLASSVVTWGLVGQLLPIMTGASYYASPENHWEELIGEHSAEWLSVSGEAARQFYEGTRAGAGVPWQPWMLPLGMWAVFVAALAAASIGLMILVHRQWIEHERLVYPLMYLPIDMATHESRGSIWPKLLRSRMLWIGAAIAIIPSVFIGLRHYYPVIPDLSLRFDTLVPIQRERILIRFWINFAVVAFAYLINADLGFSLWFFALFSAFQTPLLRLAGVSVGAKEIYSSGSLAVSNQAMGAMIFLVAASLWAAREDIAHGFREALAGLGVSREESWDATAAWGAVSLAGGLIGMIWWLMASGLSALASVLLIFAAFVTFTALTRAAVQGGVPVSRAALIPQSFVLHALGSHAVGPAGIASLAYSFAWGADIRVFLMPFAAHGLKVWHQSGVRRRSFLPLAAVTLGVALVVSTVTTLTLAYSRGGVSLSSWLFGGCPRAAFTYAASSLQNPVTPSLSWWLWMVAGAGVMWGLTAVHMRFIGWPLHPLGFAIAPTQPVQDLWFSIILGWLTKTVTLRYGGFRSYDRGIRVMLGLILGQALACAGWLVVDAIVGSTGNMIFVY